MTRSPLARTALLAAFTAASPAFGGARLEGSSENLHRNAVTAAGGRSTATGLILTNAVGETGVTAFSAAGFRLGAGHMRNFAQPGSVASITALTKTTGTLELAWTAPGLDGMNGSVSGGSYRIDYSSDPLHPFSPDTYVTSFATTVAAGAAQSYRVTGLAANTTYFARVYLADADKVASESSAASVESTLANLPPSPVVTGAFSSSVTISWALPAGGAAGFRVDAASGTTLGPSVTTTTVNGFAVSISVAGLAPNTTYYLKLGSLNWQRDVNFTAVLVAFTAAGGPVQIQALAAVPDALLRRIQLSWTNPPFINPAGVLVQVSTNPIASTPADGTVYAVGTKFPDGSVVKAGSLASSHLETSLELDTTAYFALYSKDTSNAYSVAVSTFLVLDLPPRAVAGLTSARNTAGTQVTLSWNKPTANSDSSEFKNPAAPIPWELTRLEVQVATGVIRPTWVSVSTLAASATTYTATIPDPAKTYFYRVVSQDGYSPAIDTPMTSSTGGEIFVTAPDGNSTLRIPAALASVLQPSGNPSGKTLLARAKEVPGDLAGKVMKSVTFEFVDETGKPVTVVLPDRSLDVALRYETLGGKVVPSATGANLETMVDSRGYNYCSGDNTRRVERGLRFTY